MTGDSCHLEIAQRFNLRKKHTENAPIRLLLDITLPRGHEETAASMRLSTRAVCSAAGFIFALIFFCEFFVYYVVLFNCDYPTLRGEDEDILHAMFISDTHLLGSRLGNWFDKLRREWQMHRAYQVQYSHL